MDFLASEIRPMKKRVKKNPRREEEDSSSDHSCFVANVSVSNLRDDKLVRFLTKIPSLIKQKSHTIRLLV